jgi:UDP-N-acetylmuramate--alanine ligase
LSEPDVLYLLDIYSAGEKSISGVTSDKLTEAIKNKGHKNVYYSKEPDEVVKQVLEVLKSGDLVLTLGAGTVWKLGEKIVEEIS